MTTYAFDAAWNIWHQVKESKPAANGGLIVLSICSRALFGAKSTTTDAPHALCGDCRRVLEEQEDEERYCREERLGMQGIFTKTGDKNA